MRVLVLLPALALVSCGGGESGGEGDDVETLQLPLADPEKQYLIGFGETIHFRGLSLEFTTLAGDSRCPNDPLVLCVWEGNARILLTANRLGVTNVLELNTHSMFPTSAIFQGYVIVLVRLDPYPGVTPPPAHTYVATLSVYPGDT